MTPDDAAGPDTVPTLTEVVELIDLGSAESRAERVDGPPIETARPETTWPESDVQRTTPLPSDEQIVRKVLAELERQIDVMLEYRLREVLTPLLARAADNVVRDARTQLASTLRDVVARAVASELAVQRARQSER